MGTWNAFYVRGDQNDGVTVAAVRRIYSPARIDATPEFVGVALSLDDNVAPEQQLNELSSQLRTDVIWLSFQSVVDAFEFHHWRDGARLRSLVYGCYAEERTWERADGAPEPWERDVFFTADRLATALEYAESAEKSELERIWLEGRISPGCVEPGLDSRECAYKVATFYNLPHYNS